VLKKLLGNVKLINTPQDCCYWKLASYWSLSGFIIHVTICTHI